MMAVSGMPPDGWTTYRRLLGYVWPYKLAFAGSAIAFLLGSSAEAGFVKLFERLIDNWDEGLEEAALFVPLAMLGAVLVRGVGEFVGEILLSRISFSVVHNLRVELFEQLLHMPSAFFDASAQGHLVSRITYNVAQLSDAGTVALRSFVPGRHQGNGPARLHVLFELATNVHVCGGGAHRGGGCPRRQPPIQAYCPAHSGIHAGCHSCHRGDGHRLPGGAGSSAASPTSATASQGRVTPTAGRA